MNMTEEEIREQAEEKASSRFIWIWSTILVALAIGYLTLIFFGGPKAGQ